MPRPKVQPFPSYLVIALCLLRRVPCWRAVPRLLHFPLFSSLILEISSCKCLVSHLAPRSEETFVPWSQVDGSFHSPEWHAARLASLKTSHTITWEEFKKKQKGNCGRSILGLMSQFPCLHSGLGPMEDELRKGELEADKDKMMREYRAQLDAERASKLAHGRNHSSSKSNHKKDRKDKDFKKRSSKKRKHSRRRSSESSSSSSSSESSSEDEERESRRAKSRSKRTKKEKKHRSKSKHSISDDSEGNGPLPLSKFFESAKS
ncbi:hypothetical protein CK203_086434 [Vitis vinifera]|uniref:Protein FAM133 n=1 Tax=Vitis vinifera TaxID=29760 RepID=A0A438BT26_VITVI|nr:hypothetical protein CK203_086434 [Vitis vinifera]